MSVVSASSQRLQSPPRLPPSHKASDGQARLEKNRNQRAKASSLDERFYFIIHLKGNYIFARTLYVIPPVVFF